MLCSLFYLIWWLITFKPLGRKNTIPGMICLVLASLSGLAGLVPLLRAVSEPGEASGQGIPGFLLLVGGILSYMILLAVSTVLFRRQVTSELLLITCWGTLEASVINLAYVHGSLEPVTAVQYTAALAACIVIFLGCYLLYYRIEYRKGYVVGCIPLILAFVMMAVINLRL